MHRDVKWPRGRQGNEKKGKAPEHTTDEIINFRVQGIGYVKVIVIK